MSQQVRLVRRLYRRWWWLVVGSLALVALGLGFLGFHEYFVQQGETRTHWDTFYMALQLFTLESGAVDGAVTWKLQAARLLAPALTVYAAALALFSIFYHEFQLLRLRFSRNHVIVCGLGRKGIRLVQELRKQRERVIVIEADENNASVDHCRDIGAFVLFGSADDKWVLERARVHHAKRLISVIGDDGRNVETAVLAHSLNKPRRGEPLKCVIHVSDRGLQDLFKRHELFTDPRDHFELDLFNIYESGARVMLRELPAVVSDGKRGPAQPRLLIVGFGKLGEALLVRAIRDWQIDRTDPVAKLRVTVVDADADRKREWLAVRHPNLHDAADIEFLTLDVHSHEFARGQFLRTDDGTPDVTTVHICLDSDALATYAALALHRCLQDERIPIVVRMSEEAGLATLLGAGTHGHAIAQGVHPVGMLEMTCTLTHVLGGTRETLARAMHQGYVNRKFSEEEEEATSETNKSVVLWERLPEPLKESNRKQADATPAKLAAIGCKLVPCADDEVVLFEFTDADVETMAQMEHQRWVEERLAEGWKLGKKKDPEKKISPHLIPWDDLLPNDREYNRDAARLIPRVFAKADYEIHRK